MAKSKREARKKASLGHLDHDKVFADLSKRVKQLRKEKGFKSSETFAYDIEVSRAGMAKYEAGTFDDIQFGTIIKIIDGLDISIAEFFANGFEQEAK